MRVEGLGLGFGVQSLGFGVWNMGLEVWDLGVGAECRESEVRVLMIISSSHTVTYHVI